MYNAGVLQHILTRQTTRCWAFKLKLALDLKTYKSLLHLRLLQKFYNLKEVRNANSTVLINLNYQNPSKVNRSVLKT